MYSRLWRRQRERGERGGRERERERERGGGKYVERAERRREGREIKPVSHPMTSEYDCGTRVLSAWFSSSFQRDKPDFLTLAPLAVSPLSSSDRMVNSSVQDTQAMYVYMKLIVKL